MEARIDPRPHWLLRRGLTVRLSLLMVVAVALLSWPQMAPAAPKLGAAPQDCTPPQGVPSLISPPNNSTTDSTNAPPLGIPKLIWGSVGSGNYYEVQVSADPGFPAGTTYDRLTYALTHTPVTDPNYFAYFPNGVPTYWRVRAYTPANCAGQWSDPFHFTRNWQDTPTLLSPDAGATLTYLEHPIFSWSPIPGATRYLLRISSDPTCVASIYRQYITTETEYNVAERLAPANYYWCVAPLDAASREGHLSQIRAFSFTDLASPTLYSPTNGAILTFTPAMSWSAIKGTARYRLLYSNSSDFSNAAQIDTVYTSYTPQLMLGNETNWYWKVATIDTNGRLGPFSTFATFRIVWEIQPQLLTPNNLYFHVTYPYFQWSGVPDAREYRLQIATSSSFAQNQIVVDVRTSATSYIISPPTFDLAQTYYWRIIVYGTNNIQGGTSGVFSFKFDSAGGAGSSTVPTQFWPPFAYVADPSFDRPITSSVSLPIFQWQRVTNATNYTVTFGSTINMTDTLFTATTTQPNFSPLLSDNGGSGFTFDPTRIYYWQVRCLVGGVACPVASQVWAVRVNTALDYTFQGSGSDWLQSPADLQDYVNMDPVFKWYPYPNANKYTLQVATDSNFSNIVQTASTAYAATALRQQLARELYYWRVQAYNGATLLDTSTANRLHIFGPVPYTNAANIRTISGSMVATGTVNAAAYEISAAYVTKHQDHYKFGLSISTQTGTAVEYNIPINLDYSLVDVNGQPTNPSGAPADPTDPSIQFAGDFRPEYVVKFSRSAGGTWSNPQLYAWNQGSGSYDSTVIDIVSVGGAFTTTSGYVEMSIPTGSVLSYRGNADQNVPTGDPTLIGIEPYSLDSGGVLKDTVPDDPGASGGSPTLGEFRSVSDHPNPAYPFNTDYGGNGQGIPYALSVLYSSSLAWYIPEPTESYGFDMQTAVDRGFTSSVAEYSLRLANGLGGYQFMDGGIVGGLNGARTFLPVYPANTYYWRVRTCRTGGAPCGIPGSWSRPNRFNKVNIKVDAPTVTINSGVPTFSWPRTEGAFQYQLEVHTNSQYSNLYDGAGGLENTSYTPVQDYREQDYYYRLRADEFYYGLIDQAPWTNVGTPFHITIPKPQSMYVVDGPLVNHSPTVGWSLVLEPNPNPVIGADHYELQISGSSSFNQLIEDVNTVNLNWSLGNADYANGTYYLRVRTALNNNAAFSDWATPITFTKQYPLVNVGAGSAYRNGYCAVTFTWPAFNTPGQASERSGIFGYRLETASDVNFTQNYRVVDTNNTSFTNYNDIGGCSFSAYSAVYWRVSMIDAYGRQGPAAAQVLLPSGGTPTPGGVTETPCSVPFVDIANSFAQPYIIYLYCHGIVNGVDATHFGPNQTSTRAQFSKMVVQARGLPITTPATPSFTDVAPNFFAYAYIETAAAAGIVSGYDPASCVAAGATYPCFLPNRPVTRGAVARFVVKAWNWERYTPTGGGQTFTDVPPSNTFYIFIETAVRQHVVDGYTADQCATAGATYPCYISNRNMTRAELTKPLWRAIHTPLGIEGGEE